MRWYLRLAVRRLARTPGFAATISLTLALGIGLASATGVIARQIAFAALPVRDADRVVVMWGIDRAASFTHLPLSPSDVAPLTIAMRGVATVAASDYNGANAWVFRGPDGGTAPLRIRGSLVGGTFFDLLGTRPVLGRALRADDDAIGAPRVIVLSYHTWRTLFGADSTVLGRSLFAVQRGVSYTIVGVMPPGLDVPRGVQFWTAFAPTAAQNGSLEGSSWNVDVVARLAPNATATLAREALNSFYQRLAREGKTSYAGARATVRTLPELVGGDVRPVFAALSVAAAAVLLVACGNVTALLLIRAGRRRRELAVRAAIGAARGRLVCELLAEHALLAVLAGGVGATLAAAIVRAFQRLAPAELPRVAELGLDWSLLAVVTAVTAVVVLVVGIAPALVASRVAPAESLGAAHAGAGGRSRDVRMRRILVGAQVAMALVVLTAAALVGRSLAQLSALDIGLPAADQLVFVELVPPTRADVTVGSSGDRKSALVRWRSTLDVVMSGVRASPGVVAVAPVSAPPFAGLAGWDGQVAAEGAAPEDSARRPYLNMEITNSNYLRVTGIALMRGRWFSESDREGAPRVVALSQRAAGRLFPGQDAIGRRVTLWDDSLATVVGVIGDTRYREFLEMRPSIYFPFRQFDAGATLLAVRTTSNPTTIAQTVRSVAATADPAILVVEGGTMRALTAAPLARPRLLAAVLGTYAIMVVVLAFAGLYAVIAGTVTSRRREFGVRSALGATPGALSRLVFRDGLAVAAAGTAVGLVAALLGARLLTVLLYGIRANDLETHAASAVALFAFSAAAVAPHAWRAARADPARELRAET